MKKRINAVSRMLAVPKMIRAGSAISIIIPYTGFF
jgi:hypothetical protein